VIFPHRPAAVRIGIDRQQPEVVLHRLGDGTVVIGVNMKVGIDLFNLCKITGGIELVLAGEQPPKRNRQKQ